MKVVTKMTRKTQISRKETTRWIGLQQFSALLWLMARTLINKSLTSKTRMIH